MNMKKGRNHCHNTCLNMPEDQIIIYRKYLQIDENYHYQSNNPYQKRTNNQNNVPYQFIAS